MLKQFMKFYKDIYLLTYMFIILFYDLKSNS